MCCFGFINDDADDDGGDDYVPFDHYAVHERKSEIFIEFFLGTTGNNKIRKQSLIFFWMHSVGYLHNLLWKCNFYVALMGIEENVSCRHPQSGNFIAAGLRKQITEIILYQIHLSARPFILPFISDNKAHKRIKHRTQKKEDGE